MKGTDNDGSRQPLAPPNNDARVRAAPPLPEYINIDPKQRFPRPSPPSDPELTQKAERMVRWAISSKHENSAAAGNAIVNSGGKVGIGSPDGGNDDPISAARQYIALCNLLELKSDTPLLQATLHSIVTSNSGKDIDRLVTHSKLHARLVHSIMRLDPFIPGSGRGGGDGEKGSVGMDALRELDRVRRDRKNRQDGMSSGSKVSSTERTPRSGNKRQSVQIAESSIRHKENAKYIASTLPYFSYKMADAHLHLLITIVSHNSVLSVSAVRSLWSMLTDFGSRWTEWSVGVSERLRRERKLKRSADCKKRSNQEVPCEEGNAEGDHQPAPKRRRVESQEYATPEKKCQETTEATETQENESERPVPGMGGLSVEFARDAFVMGKDLGGVGGERDANGGEEHHDNNDVVEEVYWDRLTSGRVERLLLALVNVFRLCPQSKSDLLLEISSNFPHYKTCPPASFMWYTHQCLQVVHLAPTLEGPVLCLFLDKALDMDVEIKINNKGLVTLDTEGKAKKEHLGDVTQELFDGEASGPRLGTKKRSFNQISRVSLVTSAATPTSNANTNESIFDESDNVIEISERLDTLMTMLYRRITQITAFAPDSLSSAVAAVINARRLYMQLDNVFDKKVRTTDRSKFVQFIFFVLFGRENDALGEVGRLLAKREQARLQLEEDVVKKQRMSCSADMIKTMNEMDIASEKISTSPNSLTGPLYRGFSAKLITFFLDESHAGDVHRQTAACYLASFVSRANYVSPETVCKCVGALLRWAEVYITGTGTRATKTRSSLSPVAPSGNTRRPCEVHSLFYTACQASFYMMCFRGVEAVKYYREACRHKDSSTSPHANPESVNIGPKRWKLICGHALQPLKYCLESVRLEFLHLAEDLDLFLINPADGSEKPKREESDAFLEHLWSTSSTKQSKGKPHGPSKIKSSTPKQRRRATVISTAATQEKKRLDGGVGGLGRGSNPLDSFFPFDPYLLQKSYEHVHPYYRNWEDCLLSMEDEVEKSGGDVDDGFCSDGDASEVSDLLADEEVAEDEEDCESIEGGGGDEYSEATDPASSIEEKSCVISLHGENSNFEMEIRRSRAMSSGSQCSW